MLNRDKANEITDKTENFIWDLVYFFKTMGNNEFKNTLINNKKLKNIHDGERCFILGNGPSLGKEDNLSSLKNEVVFSVNQFYRSDLFETIQPNYHIMIDPLFFELNPEKPEDNDTLVRMQKLKKYKELTCIFPFTAKKYIENYSIGTKNNYFINSRYRMHNGYKREIQMDKNLPAVQNIIHAAIYCAIYMGFKEIYLLGCDMTGMLTSFVQDDLEKNMSKEHVYEYTEEEKKRMMQVRLSNSNEVMLNAYGLTFSIFRNIYEYCINNDIEIYNATQGGALDNIPRINFSELIKKKGAN